MVIRLSITTHFQTSINGNSFIYRRLSYIVKIYNYLNYCAKFHQDRITEKIIMAMLQGDPYKIQKDTLRV